MGKIAVRRRNPSLAGQQAKVLAGHCALSKAISRHRTCRPARGCEISDEQAPSDARDFEQRARAAVAEVEAGSSVVAAVAAAQDEGDGRDGERRYDELTDRVGLRDVGSERPRRAD